MFGGGGKKHYKSDMFCKIGLKQVFSHIYDNNVTMRLYHRKIANFGARQATLSDIACQAALAFVAETKLLVYNDI